MNNLFRGLIAGYGAKKLGGGCFSMVLIFIVIWVALGQCDHGSFGERRRHKQELLKEMNQRNLIANHNEGDNNRVQADVEPTNFRTRPLPKLWRR